MSAVAIHVGEPRIAVRTPAPSARRWVRWLAAWATLAPGGGLAYQLATQADE
jgi:hypothetical protein